MANELKHDSTATASGSACAKTDWEDVNVHILDSQATGDLIYASSATQLTRLGAGTEGHPLIMGASVPQWGGNIVMDANRIVFTDVSIKRFDTNLLGFYDAAGSVIKGLYAGTITLANIGTIAPYSADTYALYFKARDTGVGDVEVGRLEGAADPFFSLGNDGNALVATYAGLLGFHGSTPCNKADAYTQTYSTADRTVANPTCATMGDLVATSGGWGASSEVNFDKITTAVDQIIADNLDLRQAITALIDDLQEVGLVG